MTQLNWGKQLALAVTLFVLGTFAYWLEFKHKPKKESEEAQQKKIFALKDTPVEAIKVRNGGKAFEFRCADLGAKLCKPGDNSKWEIEAPLKVKADDSNVNSLVSTLNNISSSDSIDLKEETPEKRAALLKEYGLDPASRASERYIEVKTAKGPAGLFLGLTHPIGDNIFALETGADGKPDETHVLLVPNYFKSNFDHALTYWRDKKLLAIGSHEVESFTLSGSKAKVTATRKDGQWNLKPAAGEELPGDLENIDAMLAAVAYLSAKEFVTNDKTDAKGKATLKGAKPLLTLTLQKEKGTQPQAPAPTTLTLYLKKGAPERLYATVSGSDPLYELEPSTRERLDKELKDLRQTKVITSLERFTAKRLELAGGGIGSPLVLTSADAKWSSKELPELDGEKVQQFLDKLAAARIQSFLTGKAVPKGEEQGLRFTLGDEKNEAKRRLVFWKADGKLYARDLNSKRPEAFLMDTGLLDAVPWDRAALSKSAPAPSAAPQK